MNSENQSQTIPQSELVMFGDSITEWGPWSQALSEFQPVNQGIAGDTTAGMVRRLDASLNAQPKLVCVMAGINDLAQGWSVDQTWQRYRTMLNIWREHQIDILVQSTLYVGTPLAALNPQVSELNALLKSYCEQHELNWLDVNAILAPEGVLGAQYSNDALHLNAAAYQLWVEQLEPLLVTLLRKTIQQ